MELSAQRVSNGVLISVRRRLQKKPPHMTNQTDSSCPPHHLTPSRPPCSFDLSRSLCVTRLTWVMTYNHATDSTLPTKSVKDLTKPRTETTTKVPNHNCNGNRNRNHNHRKPTIVSTERNQDDKGLLRVRCSHCSSWHVHHDLPRRRRPSWCQTRQPCRCSDRQQQPHLEQQPRQS